jgi:exosortase/archaeosortase family protein
VNRPRLSAEAAFGVRFFSYLLLSSVVFWWFSLHLALGPVQRAMAWTGALLGRLAGGEMVATGDYIIIETLTLHINHECTGIFVLMLFASFVLAYPTTWRSRLLGVGIGLPALFAINVFRLGTLARLVEIYPGAFFYFHEYVWQGVFMVVVLVGAIAWAERSE